MRWWRFLPKFLRCRYLASKTRLRKPDAETLQWAKDGFPE